MADKKSTDKSSPVLGARGIGQGTQWDPKSYSVSGYSYPADLLGAVDGGNPYGGNFVVFYINVSEDSQLFKKNTTAFYDAARVRQNLRGESISTGVDDVTANVLIGAAVGLAAAKADIVGKALNTAGIPLNKATSLPSKVVQAAQGVVGAAAGVAMFHASGLSNQPKYQRMKKAIALHVPTDLQIKYGVQWEEDTQAGVGAMVQSGITDVIGAAGMQGPLGSYLTGMAIQTPMGAFFGKRAGIAGNPKKEQLFKNVDFRTFSFQYQFLPRSASEAEAVRNIIREFKLHMHPEYKADSNNFLFTYPSEFDIVYYQNNKENLNLHRHTSCVLTDLSVSYSPNGIYSTFDDGMPTQINVSLTFKELAILTKQNILDGY